MSYVVGDEDDFCCHSCVVVQVLVCSPFRKGYLQNKANISHISSHLFLCRTFETWNSRALQHCK
jgi:hypothetical protein